MKSLNVKKIAAVVAGAGLIASAFSTGLALVKTSPNATAVGDFVKTVKDNLDKTQVVVGSTADISDGIAAAKIAATLATLNYPAGEAVIGEKSVKVSTGAGVISKSTADSWKTELDANASATAMFTNARYATGLESNDLTYNQLTKVLKLRTITPTINSTAKTYSYEDKILLNSTRAYYDEESATPGKHGLFLQWPSNGEQSGLFYQVVFTTPLPISSVNSYQDWPEIYLMGDKVTIDPTNTDSDTLVLSTGTKYVTTKGQSITSGNYTIKVDSIGSVTTTSGTQYAVTLTVSKGTTTATSTINSGSSGTFINEEVTITVESVVYPDTATLRVGFGSTKFNEADPWTLNGLTKTTTEWKLQSLNATNTELSRITLKYGNAQKSGMKYDFGSDYSTAMLPTQVISGPITAAGKPFFQVSIKGFGSTSTAIDTTTLSFKGLGGETAGDFRILPTWTSRSGVVQTWGSEKNSTSAFMLENPAQLFTNVTLNLSSSPARQWTIINDKVVYLSTMTRQSGTYLYDLTFKIGGSAGKDLSVYGVNGSQTGTLSDSDSQLPIYCTLAVNASAEFTDDRSVFLSPVSGYTGAIGASIDQSSGRCDAYPEVVPFGKNTEIRTAVPSMDMRWYAGNYTMNSSANAVPVGPQTNVTGVSTDADIPVEEPWPFIIVNESATAANAWAVVFDADDSSGADQYRGLLVYNATLTNTTIGGSYNNTNVKLDYVNTSNANYINLAQQTVYDNARYHMNNYSTEFSAPTGTNDLTVIIPETPRNVILEVAAEIAAANATETLTTAKENETVSDVTIKEISCPAAGAFTQKTAALVPKNLVALDSAATATYKVVMGGPWVNSVAAALAASTRALVTGAAGDQALAVEGNNMLVAGYTATDTATAADELITLLTA